MLDLAVSGGGLRVRLRVRVSVRVEAPKTSLSDQV